MHVILKIENTQFDMKIILRYRYYLLIYNFDLMQAFHNCLAKKYFLFFPLMTWYRSLQKVDFPFVPVIAIILFLFVSIELIKMSTSVIILPKFLIKNELRECW